MPEITNELMYEILKSVQAQVAIVREDMDSVVVFPQPDGPTSATNSPSLIVSERSSTARMSNN
jgi:hypothetical protein